MTTTTTIMLLDHIHSIKGYCYDLPVEFASKGMQLPVTIFTALAILCYGCFLMYSLINDAPVLVTVTTIQSYIKTPSKKKVKAAFEFDVNCTFLNPDPICTDYISNLTDLTESTYWFKFNASEIAAFSQDEIEDNTDETKNINLDRISAIEFTFEKSDSSQLNYRSYIKATLWDSGNDDEDSVSLGTLSQTTANNRYFLSPFQNNFINFRRYKNESLVHSIRNVLGVPPSELFEAYYIDTTFQTANIAGNQTHYLLLTIRLLTYEGLAIVSELGGAYAPFMSAFLYTFGLYLCYKKPITPKKFIERFNDNVDENQDDPSLTTDTLDTRLKRVEKLLSEYNFNV
ncbi:11293_t:CDS:2 [Ambispora gerdemannii]|uniref:11293_t:CDS:1 n=1 Tax=Ambispora gerdemannii TaxID=144530 RepID=A0A9N8Z9D3_9GLOM|nr:11293_t:CDS:2 [Ambispora gerdemannii]